ncbi:Aldehyde/histidinol dehydrogenase [Exophiala viscosa]|uniref:Succinate-semialdehyde dehydrogenase n=1 Tax=Exophiala viscosa TaxID=2486360 RepID=A0AAN6II06_9EURO|nr:Aldehyde/histidinol dehydrogenase [Exophiala viscosa]
MSYSLLQLSDSSLLKNLACINGKWVAAKSGKTFEVQDPASNKAIATMPDMGKDETEEAINAAAAALPSFRQTTARDRGRLLRKWYDLMIENAEDLAKLVTWENGKTLQEARAEIQYAAMFFEWFSEEAPRAYGDVIPASVANHRVQTRKEPIGVCGLITPWNWPAGMITRKVGAAVAAGCTVVLKSPGETPLTAAALIELGQRAGVPAGVVNLVSALENTVEVGNTLTSSKVVKKVSFTGSTRVGKILMEQAASTLKKLSFELGGNAPFIVFDDADLEDAVAGAIQCKFKGSGQTCTCANRIYVQKTVYNAFVEAFVAEVEKFQTGPGYKDGVTFGPLIYERALTQAERHISDAVEKGAKIVSGGSRMPKLGANFFQPTVISGMTADMLLAHEETFGPVAGIFPFETEEQVVRLANDTEVGLTGYFYSKDVDRCRRVAEALEVGMVGVNTGAVSDVAMPFGGIKESGFGREGSRYGMDEYMVLKSVTYGGADRPLDGA